MIEIVINKEALVLHRFRMNSAISKSKLNYSSHVFPFELITKATVSPVELWHTCADVVSSPLEGPVTREHSPTSGLYAVILYTSVTGRFRPGTVCKNSKYKQSNCSHNINNDIII